MAAPQPPHGGDSDEDIYLGDEARDDDEEEEAFIDLEDPDNKVEEIDGSAPPPEEEEGPAGGAQAGGGDTAEFPVDKVPERDDSVFSFGSETRQPLHAVAAHPTVPTRVATAGEDDTVYILDIAHRTTARSSGSTALPDPTSAAVAVLKGHEDTVTVLAFSPDGTMLASGSMDSTVRIWSTKTWECTFTLQDFAAEVEFLLWHPSSRVLVGGAADAQALLWNTTKGTVAQYFTGHRGGVTCGKWAMDFKKVLTGSADGSLMLFNPKTGEAEVTFGKDLSSVNAAITCMSAVNAAADLFVVGCEDGSLHVVSLVKGKVMKTLDEVHEQAVEAIQFASLESGIGLFATCSCDCRLVVWSATDYTIRSVTRCGEGITRLLWIGPLLVAGCTDGDTRVWDGRTAAGPPRTTLMGHRKLVLGLTATSDAKYLLTAADDGTVLAFTKQRYELDEPTIAASALAATREQVEQQQQHDTPAAAAAEEEEG